jgi:biotin carboxylase
VDKVRQRNALATAGVQSTASVPLHTPEDLGPALAATGLPAVLKPRSGAGSVDACLVHSARELAERFAEFSTNRRAESGYVLERYLVGDPDTLGPFWGDYVSVESLVHHGEVHTVTMTGKLPLVPPFRETGMFIPAAVPAPLAEQVIELERAALGALGILHGATHTEIKFTPDGPRIIEVNGRMGGHIADPLSRAAGVDLIALTLRLALGLCEPPAPLLTVGLRCPEVAYQFLLTPPEQTSVPGDPSLLDALADLPGVSLVDVAVEPDWQPDWRAGTEWLLGTVYGTAADHQALRETVEQLRERTKPFWRRRQDS